MITPLIFLGKRCYLCYEECSNQDTSLIAQTVPHLGIDIGVENPNKLYDHGEQYERLRTKQFNMKRLFCDPSTFSLNTYEPYKVSKETKKHIDKARSILEAIDRENGKIWDSKSSLKKYQFVVIWRSGRAILNNYVGKRPWYKQYPSKIRRTFLQANKCPAYLFHPGFINIVTL